jgi:hypothetical protein
MNKQLLKEYISFINSPLIINESLSKPGENLFVTGKLGTVEKINGNGRYYARELWEREIEKFNQKILSQTTDTCGELDHPDSQIINLKNASHAIRKIWWEGDDIMGLLEIFCSEGRKGNVSGRIAGSFFYNKLLTGISSRGMGSLKQVGEIMEVQDDFELLTWDLVSTPSNQGSFMSPVNLNEGLSSPFDPYRKVNSVLYDILCSNGSCPLN